MSLEIERKFLLKDVPASFHQEKLEITQGYFDVEDCEIRIRRIKNLRNNEETFFLCKKKDITINSRIREETEEQINKNVFYILWDIAYKTNILKTRYVFKFEGYKWEIDRFHGLIPGLVIAEIELNNIDSEFEIPNILKDLIIKEVTNEKRYRNGYLARYGCWWEKEDEKST